MDGGPGLDPGRSGPSSGAEVPGGWGGGVTDVDCGMRLRTSCMTVKDSRPSLLCVNEWEHNPQLHLQSRVDDWVKEGGGRGVTHGDQ